MMIENIKYVENIKFKERKIMRMLRYYQKKISDNVSAVYLDYELENYNFNHLKSVSSQKK